MYCITLKLPPGFHETHWSSFKFLYAAVFLHQVVVRVTVEVPTVPFSLPENDVLKLVLDLFFGSVFPKGLPFPFVCRLENFNIFNRFYRIACKRISLKSVTKQTSRQYSVLTLGLLGQGQCQ